jgi:hypothetical protein
MQARKWLEFLRSPKKHTKERISSCMNVVNVVKTDNYNLRRGL